VLALDLGREVAEHDDGGLIRAEQERPDEEVGRREGGFLAVGGKSESAAAAGKDESVERDARRVLGVEFDNHEVDAVGQVHLGAEAKV